MSTSTTTVGRLTARADCAADASGGIAFRVSGTAGATALLLRRLGPGPAEELRLPLTAAGDGTATALLGPEDLLPEGRWEVLTEDGRAVVPGVRDLRVLVDGPAPDAGRAVIRVPYPLAEDRLAVRSWVRTPHAEAGALRIDRDRGAVTVTGRLHGAELGPGARAEVRLAAAAPAPSDASGVPVLPAVPRQPSRAAAPAGRVHDASPAPVHELPVAGEGDAFSFTVLYTPLVPADGEDLYWELWLRPAEGAAAVRVARILDDVWDRAAVFVYPEHRTGSHRAAPCYTPDNDLCVRVLSAAG
ncbi:hypothetical protein [Streptomyces sp. NPDC005805]|uniref:hypothetical protein n=1 Tax=Streptomyces sp. NPDC005805 TaxID=3157068 RepID=UPI0033FD5CB0